MLLLLATACSYTPTVAPHDVAFRDLTLAGATVDVTVAVHNPLPASADVDDFAFDSFHADMLLTRAADGHAELSVTETLVARFPDSDQNRGIVRAIERCIAEKAA